MRRRIHLASVLVCLSVSMLLGLSGDIGEAADPQRLLLPATSDRPNTSSLTPETTIATTAATWQTIVSQSFGPDGCSLPCPGWNAIDVDDNRSNIPDTRLVYGPFDLSDAVDAQVDFMLWRETQPDYDSLKVEVSTDGSHFKPLQSWNGSEPATSEQRNWLPASVSLRDLTRYRRPSGENRVWLAWRFPGDYGDKSQGPWVDDISIMKLVPGSVNVYGWVNYFNRAGNRIPARRVTVHIVDHNIDGHPQEMAYTQTNDDGRFQIDGIQNYEYWDMYDPDSRLDLYIVVEANAWDSGVSYHRVTYIAGGVYKWNEFCLGEGCVWTGAYWNVPDGDVERSYDVAFDDPNKEAMWLFRDARRAWEYVDGQSMTDPGSIVLAWENAKNCYYTDRWVCDGSFFWAGGGTPFAFIQDQVTSSSDTVVHEIAHGYMHSATGWWYWYGSCWGHYIFTSKEESCGWSEGWADFFSLTVNGDRCYDKVSGPCGGTGQVEGTHYYDLENQGWSDTRPRGYTVESRVAGALYDLYDSINEPSWDTAAEGFVPIWIIVRDSEPAIPTLAHFGIRWGNSGHSYFQFLLASYQNTIEYYNALWWNRLPLIMK